MPKAMISGDRLLLAINVLDIGSVWSENFKNSPDLCREYSGPFGLDALKTQAKLEQVFGAQHNLHPRADSLRYHLYPLLRGASGLGNVEFEIDAIIKHFMFGNPPYRVWGEERGVFQRFFGMFACSELTEADFK